MDAYTQLVRMHEQIAFRTAHLITGNPADAQDAAQETFVKAHDALWRFRPETLLWQHGPLTLRLEGARSKATALRIARAVR